MRTLGEILYKARNEQNATLEEVENKLKIRKKFLTALEQNDFQAFPGTTYIKGYLKIYSDFLHLNPRQMLALYRRQVDDREMSVEIKTGLIKEKSLKMTPKLFLSAVAAGFIFIFSLFIFREYRVYVSAPFLKIYTPHEAEKSLNGSIVVSGKTSPETAVNINNQVIPVKPDGSFQESVALLKGENMLVVSAVNSFGNKNEKKLTIFYQPQE